MQALSENYKEYTNKRSGFISIDQYLMSIDQYFKVIRPNLNRLLHTHRIKWKVQLAIVNEYLSLTDNDDEQKMYRETDNITIMIGTNINGSIIKKFFQSPFKKYQESIQVMNCSHNAYDSIEKFYYKFHKISLTRRSSYIPTPKWMKNQKATLNV